MCRRRSRSRWFRHAGGMTPACRWLPCRVGTCRLRSGGDRRAAGDGAAGCGEIAAMLAPFAFDDLPRAAPQRRRPVAGGWTTGPRSRSGTASCAPAARSPASSPPMTAYASTSRSGSRAITRPDGGTVLGPAVRWIGRRHGRRQDRRWARAWSPEQIANRLRVDFPDDQSMRISHEAIYQALYVQGRGALRRELTACSAHRPSAAGSSGPDPRPGQEVRHP